MGFPDPEYEVTFHSNELFHPGMTQDEPLKVKILCDDPEGWDREDGREAQEGHMGIYVYLQLIHFVVQQKITQHCKAIILQ